MLFWAIPIVIGMMGMILAGCTFFLGWELGKDAGKRLANGGRR